MKKILHILLVLTLTAMAVSISFDGFAQKSKKKKKRKKKDEPVELVQEQEEIIEDIVISSGYKDQEILEELSGNAELKEKLDGYFFEIANNKGIDIVNEHIETVKTMFASDESPVLISMGIDDSGQAIYDKPMTITEYLNYLKFRKDYRQQIKDLSITEEGHVTKLVMGY